MIFTTGVGNIDIQVNDYVFVNESCLPPSPEGTGLGSLGYFKVLQVTAANPAQLQMKYINQDKSSQNLWIDALWLMGNLRPILPS